MARYLAMAIGNNLISNAVQAVKAMVSQTAAPVGLREIITRQFPGAQTAVDSVITFFDKMRELNRAGKAKTDSNTLDKGEFYDEVKNLKKTFAVSLNPFHYIWSFAKYVLGFGTKTETRVQELERFGGLASMPYGPNIYAVEACETLIKIIHDRQRYKQNLLSRLFFPNKLATDPVLKAAQGAMKSWIPKIANLEQLKIIANRLKYDMPDYISEDLGNFAQRRVKEATEELARLRQGPASSSSPASTARPEAMHKAAH